MKLIYKLTFFTFLVFLVSIILFASCKKEESANPSEDASASQASSEADADAEIIFNEIFDNVMGVNTDVGMGGVGVFGQMFPGAPGQTARIDACPSVTITRLNSSQPFPVKIVMDFGTGCSGRDGRNRSGKIIAIYTNRLIYPDAKATTTFEEYKVDSVLVQGTFVISNISTIGPNNPLIIHKWKTIIEGAKLSKPNGNYTEWNSTKTITQIEGNGTPLFPLDDIYKIEGSGNGKVKKNNQLIAWKAEIIEPLVKKFSCRWIIKGVIKVVRLTLTDSSPWVGILNYGSGDCDKKAIITINGELHEITLP
jgi:hypothetical protein